jgi:hypothetical protein
MTDLIANLRENFGAPPDTSTVKGITRYCEMWIAEEAAVNSPELMHSCEAMLKRLSQAIKATESDLEKTGPTHESLADPVERSIHAYERLQEILRELKDVIGSEDRSKAVGLLEELRQASDFLHQAQMDMENWVKHEIPRCPRCGTDEADPCPNCGLQLMYLDPSGGMKVKDASANLPPEFGRLYSAITRIRDGEAYLEKLGTVLPPVEKSVNTFLASVSAARQQNRKSQNLGQSEECLREIKTGLELLRATLSSRRITDLQKGWLQVFRSAVKLQDVRRSLLEEFGGEQGREMAARERESQTRRDSISLNHED